MARQRIGIDARMCWTGGIGRYVRNLINGLLREDKDDTFVVLINPDTPPGSDRAPTVEETAARVYDWIAGGDNLEVVSFRDPLPPMSWREQAWVPQWCRERKLDLLHVPHFNAPLAGRTPLVANIHDVTYLRRDDVARSRLRAFAARFLLRRTASRARFVITGTQAARRDVVAALGLASERVRVVGHGADEFLDVPEASGSGCLAAPAFPEGIPFQFFLHIGNHRPHKNVERLLRAMADLRARSNERVCFACVVLACPDDAWSRATRARCAELGLEVGKAVRFVHDPSDIELRWLYANARALVLPSLEEGYGLPALEAAAAACPVIASRVPAVHEVLGEDAAAWVSLAGDGRELADRMESFLADAPARERMVARGRDRAHKKRWTKTARATLAVYEEALGLRDAPAAADADRDADDAGGPEAKATPAAPPPSACAAPACGAADETVCATPVSS